MDREDIIKLAREAGFDPHDWAKAWAPLPKVPAHIKKLLLESST